MKKFVSDDKLHELWALFVQTHDVIWRIRQRELTQYNIPISQSAILFIIQLIGNKATPAEISRQLFREPHTVSSCLDRMEKAGLVRRVKDLKRKNMIRVVITKKGHKAYQLIANRESTHRLMSILSVEEQQQLWSFLQKLRYHGLKELGMEKNKVFPPQAEHYR